MWGSEALEKQREWAQVKIAMIIIELLSRFHSGGNGYGDDGAFK